MNRQHLEVAQRILSGEKPGQIAGQLGITIEAVTAIRKGKGYRKVEADLANKMMEAAGSELQALAGEAVEKLRAMLRIPVKNLTGQNGSERRRADPHLLKEQRMAALAILEMGLKVAEKQADSAESQALDARLLIDTDHD